MLCTVLGTARGADPLPDLQNSNHLEPISAYDRGGYGQAVFDLLVEPGVSELWMICKPSRSQEYALILRTKPLVPSNAAYQFQQKNGC